MTDTTVETAADELSIATEELQKFLTGVAPSIAERGMDAPVFTNDKSNPAPFGVLDMIYKGVFTNTLGVMTARHRGTGKEMLLLCGIAGTEVYPVAICIGADQAKEFSAPDGEGGWIDVTDKE